jgi:hypothetical protein
MGGSEDAFSEYFRREQSIDILVSKKHPLYKAAQASLPLSSNSSRGISHDDRQKIIKAAEEYRDELSTLSDLALKGLVDQEQARAAAADRAKKEREEKSRFFNHVDARADFDHWGKAAYWSIDEAIALLLGKSPKVVTWERVKPYEGVSPFAARYAQIRDLAQRSVAVKELYAPALPAFFLAWAKRMDFQIPDELERIVSARGPIQDWRSLYESEKAAHQITSTQLADVLAKTREFQQQVKEVSKRISDLIVERDDLREKLAEANASLEHRWPWGNYETELLDHLGEAARQWWSTYDPDEVATAPTNEQVEAWLQERGVSKRAAEVMAQILRADGLRTGPR